jgi:hypothetical protein
MLYLIISITFLVPLTQYSSDPSIVTGMRRNGVRAITQLLSFTSAVIRKMLVSNASMVLWSTTALMVMLG